MARLPTRDDLGRMPSARSGRVIAQYDTSAAGRGLADLGASIAGAATDIARIGATVGSSRGAGGVSQAEQFEAQRKFLEFQSAQEQAYEESKGTVDPGAFGFREKAQNNYKNAAKEFFKSIPDALKPEYDMKLFATEDDFLSKSRAFETTERTRYYGDEIDKGLDSVRIRINNNAAPYEELKSQGLALIDAADMPDIWKAERRSGWDADAAESKWQLRFKNNPQEAISQIKSPQGGNVGRAYQRLISKGWTPAQAAGVVGNLTAESGKSLNTQARNPGDGSDGSDSIGVAQWNGARARALKAFAAARGTDWHDFDTQIDFVDHELRTSERSAGENLARATNAEEAAAAFTGYERPAGWSAGNAKGSHNWSGRRDAALRIAGENPVSEDADLENIPYDRRQQLANWGETQYTKQVNEQAAQTRAEIEIATANAPTAIQNTGEYSGTLPTSDQFMQAYGPQDGAQKYNKLMAAVETSQQAYKMQTLPVGEIQQIVNAAKPTASGDTAALDNARYDTLQKAAQETIKARNADPSAYVQQTFPHVAQAWQEAETSGDYRTALAATASAQQQLGIRDMQLLPKQTAAQTITSFKDETVSGEQRIGAVTGMIFSTGDPAQRKAIFDQLVEAGLPDATEGAIEAYARGDEGAGRRLMEAAIIDPSKLPGTTNLKPSDIDAEIQAKIMDDGQIGDIFYGLSDGTVENQERAIRDSKLLTNAVNLRVRNGETLDAAVQSAAKDLYGDIKPITGDLNVNAQVLLPAEADDDAYIGGFTGLLPAVRSQLETSVVVPEEAGIADGGKAVLQGVRSNYIENVMSEGYFRNSGDGYVFIDPFVGAAVAGPDGKPLIFTDSDVLGASTTAPPDLGLMSNEPESQPMQRTQEEIDRETYGEFAPMLNELMGGQ